MSRSEWQKILIENGYFARSVPKEYGGYGGEADILRSRIIAAEFSKSKLQERWAVKGLICWFQHFRDRTDEEQKQAYIKPTSMEK